MPNHPTFRLRLYGHRGASALLPENTLPAFERALADGANALELDIHQTADGHWVVAHDPHGERLAGVPERIQAISVEQVRKWNVAERTAAGERHTVPTLDEVLAAFPDTPMSIDHKPVDAAGVPSLLELIAGHRAEDRITLASFSLRAMRRIRGLGYAGRTALTRPEVACLRLLPRSLARALVRGEAAQIPTHSGPLRLDTRRFLNRCRSLGIRVDYWVVNEPEEARRLLDRGATGVMTDDPARIAPVCGDLETVSSR